MDAGLIVVDIGGVWLREWVGIWEGVSGWVSWDVGGGVENGGWVGSGKIHRTPGIASDWTDIGWQGMVIFSQFNDESSTNYTVQHIAGITVIYFRLSPDQKITHLPNYSQSMSCLSQQWKKIKLRLNWGRKCQHRVYFLMCDCKKTLSNWSWDLFKKKKSIPTSRSDIGRRISSQYTV